jgi:hypothetical protein
MAVEFWKAEREMLNCPAQLARPSTLLLAELPVAVFDHNLAPACPASSHAEAGVYHAPFLGRSPSLMYSVCYEAGRKQFRNLEVESASKLALRTRGNV